MSNEKGFITESLPDVTANARRVGAALPRARQQAAMVALEVDTNDDPGGDPYNYTGSFCVPEFSDD
jgi:hypothetical protein